MPNWKSFSLDALTAARLAFTLKTIHFSSPPPPDMPFILHRKISPLCRLPLFVLFFFVTCAARGTGASSESHQSSFIPNPTSKQLNSCGSENRAATWRLNAERGLDTHRGLTVPRQARSHVTSQPTRRLAELVPVQPASPARCLSLFVLPG